jgi:DNA repair photolyase
MPFEPNQNHPPKGRGTRINVSNPFLKRHNSSENIDEHVESLPQDELTQFISVEPKAILSSNDSPDVPFRFSINPYQGCEHGCIYCYARNSHFYWGYSAGLDFERKILVKHNAPDLLLEAISKKNYLPEPITISGNTDPYQPAERKFRITRSLLEIFDNYRHPVGLITKNSLILRDADILQSLAKDNLVHVNISITSRDELLRSRMEPRTTTYAQRLKAVEKLSSLGVPVNVLIAPVIPSINDHEIPAILKDVAEAGAVSSGYTFVRLNGALANLFEDWLQQNYPERTSKVISMISSGHQGKMKDSRWHSRMQGDGQIASVIKNLFNIHRRKNFEGRQMPAYNLNTFVRPAKGQLSLFSV